MRIRSTLSQRVGFLCVLAGILVALPASAQKKRMKAYEDKLEQRIGEVSEEFRAAQREARTMEVREKVEAEQKKMVRKDPAALQQALAKDPGLSELARPFKYVVHLQDSNDGEGQDVEIRITMPVDAFMEFAPVAALEAAAVNHKFPVVYIYLREETTDRVARVAFRDAEPIAGRYLAGDEGAVAEMEDTLIWH